jgi:hypothetical protein
MGKINDEKSHNKKKKKKKQVNDGLKFPLFVEFLSGNAARNA